MYWFVQAEWSFTEKSNKSSIDSNFWSFTNMGNIWTDDLEVKGSVSYLSVSWAMDNTSWQEL